MLVLLSLTLAGADLTVTLQDAVFPLYSFILISAVPGFFAVITALFAFPFVTEATLVFELLHLRFTAFAYEPLFVLSDIV